MAEKECPACGQTLPLIGEAPHLKLPPLQAKIFLAVRRAGKHGISSERLVHKLYADAEDGGPLTARNTMRVHIYDLNKSLVPIGLKIKGGGGRGGAIYRLETAPK